MFLNLDLNLAIFHSSILIDLDVIIFA